jgi:hypothetical protein
MDNRRNSCNDKKKWNTEFQTGKIIAKGTSLKKKTMRDE